MKWHRIGALLFLASIAVGPRPSGASPEATPAQPADPAPPADESLPDFIKGQPHGPVYFMRFHYANGTAALAHSDGVTKLLHFLNHYVHCEPTERVMDSSELRDKYLAHRQLPYLLYLYCDENFSFSDTDVQVLNQYLAHGGFLFIDSAPSELATARARRELSRFLPESLKPLPNDHPIYKSFLFSMKHPAFGENYAARTNYGVTRNGHLVVFYTPGNFSDFYETYDPTTCDPNIREYVSANYQMGCNVVEYALNRGVPMATSIKGADGGITASVVMALVKEDDGEAATPAAAKSTDPPAKPGG